MMKMLEGYEKKELCHLMYLGFAGFIPEIQDLNIHCPVCLVVGDKDKTGKVRKYNEQWHNKTGYPLHIIKNASHNVNVDKPNELNQIMDIFIKQLNI
ncbi:alpha/beta hydrolase, partial [Clostridioides difficile]|nr:alpha/beta hydrolase [Clostridioides difficile]